MLAVRPLYRGPEVHHAPDQIGAGWTDVSSFHVLWRRVA